MKTIEIQVYSFNELSEKAQEKVINDMINQNNFEYIFEDASKTVKKFFELFNIRIIDFDFLESYRNHYSIPENIIGKQLQRFMNKNFYEFFEPKTYWLSVIDPITKLSTFKKRKSKITFVCNCPLTSMCYDMDILEPVLEYYKDCTKYNDLDNLIKACVNNLCKSVQQEYYSCLTKEAIQETCEANDYYFTIDGKLD
jgi:hypothetical protein